MGVTVNTSKSLDLTHSSAIIDSASYKLLTYNLLIFFYEQHAHSVMKVMNTTLGFTSACGWAPGSSAHPSWPPSHRSSATKKKAEKTQKVRIIFKEMPLRTDNNTARWIMNQVGKWCESVVANVTKHPRINKEGREKLTSVARKRRNSHVPFTCHLND